MFGWCGDGFSCEISPAKRTGIKLAYVYLENWKKTFLNHSVDVFE